jgi:cation:H+ antiporter
MTGALWIILGLVTLVVGAELLVRGATRLALALGVSPLVLGLTIVSIGTSAPELAVGITANLQGSGSLAIGNIAGTNVFNLLFILGLTAAIHPLQLQLRLIRIELPVALAAGALLWLFTLNGTLSILEGGVLVALGALYTAAIVRLSRKESPEVREEFSGSYGVPTANTGVEGSKRAVIVRAALGLLIGLALTLVGAEWLVDGSVTVARNWGIPEAIIGLTIVSAGTSAPELVTTIVATLRGERDVAIGNLLGSSIFNILIILGLTAVASSAGIGVERDLIRFDIPVMLASFVLCIPAFLTGRRLSRIEGIAGVALYVGYITWLVLTRT